LLRNWCVLFLVSMAATGCVSKKYKALQAELDATRAELSGKLDTQTGRTRTVEDELAAEKALSASLGEQIAALQNKNALLLKDKSALDADVAQMQAALKELMDRKAAADARIKEFNDLLAKFKSMIDSGKLKVKMVGGRMVVELASDILFPSGSASLSPEGKTAILEVATVLASIPERAFQVEGHTDDDPIRTERFPSNWELGAGRAITVVQALQEGGVPVTRLSAASFAQNRPVAPNKTPEGKGSNRRIEIVVVPDLSLLPGYDELERMANQ
jgi:chemotaxis protein MotB